MPLHLLLVIASGALLLASFACFWLVHATARTVSRPALPASESCLRESRRHELARLWALALDLQQRAEQLGRHPDLSAEERAEWRSLDACLERAIGSLPEADWELVDELADEAR